MFMSLPPLTAEQYYVLALSIGVASMLIPMLYLAFRIHERFFNGK